MDQPKLVESQKRYVLETTGISHIVLCDEAISVIKILSRKIKEINKKLIDGKGKYEDFEAMRRAFGEAYDKIIDIARRDLQDETERKVF
jgi:thiazole synthase ThiGH ThiG subunit